MFELDGFNEFSRIGSILNEQELTPYQIQERKFLYIEGLIRFLELYAQNEIGNVEVDIEKIALWVNSPYFENVDIYKITSIDKVYEMLTEDILDKNIPLYRFLKLSDYQLRIMEKEHKNILLQNFYEDASKYPCLKCIWYHTSLTQFGQTSTCRLPNSVKNGSRFVTVRQGYLDITSEEHRNCKFITMLDNYEQFLNDFVYGRIDSCVGFDSDDKVKRRVKEYLGEFENKLNYLDNSYIPIVISKTEKVDLAEEIDCLADLGRAFNNKLPMADMQRNLRFAIFLEAMIRFVEIYAQMELGTDFIADISKIAKYVEDYLYDKKSDLFNFKNKAEIYSLLENITVENDNFLSKFIKRKEI
jgi:hypothetical protein